jgi:hypothetical protein
VKKTIFVFGVISGVISSVLMISAVTLLGSTRFGHSYVLGYTSIVLSLLLVYFGVRSYRDNVANGQITFGKAFLVGLAITVISCLFYVATWEVVYFKFMPDFMDKYGAEMIQKMQASGATAAAIQQKSRGSRKPQSVVQEPLLQYGHDLYRTVSRRPRHDPAFRRHPPEECADRTRSRRLISFHPPKLFSEKYLDFS